LVIYHNLFRTAVGAVPTAREAIALFRHRYSRGFGIGVKKIFTICNTG